MRFKRKKTKFNGIVLFFEAPLSMSDAEQEGLERLKNVWERQSASYSIVEKIPMPLKNWIC